jgi:hypothetical protein
MNLNELIKKYSLLENEEGELTENWEAEMDALGETIEAKLEGSCRLIQSFDQRADIVALEIERLKRLKAGYESRSQGLRHWLTYCLNGQKTEVGLFKLSFRKSEAVEIVDESLIPAQYMREKVSISPAKDEIKADLKAGAQIPGAMLKQNLSLQIK